VLASARLPLRHALALGAIQGPAELLPVSSSGHLVLVPVLLGWPYGRLDPELRKAYEVALHAGTASALVVALRTEVVEVARALDVGRLLSAALAFGPPAVAALLFERAIEKRLGAPRQVAAAQVAAGLVLAAADRAPATRSYEEAGPADHLALGLAQAAALAPGVSRNGATLTAARLRRLDRPAASRLSRHAALPVIAAAGVLKGVRLARRGMPADMVAPFAAGAGAALASTYLARGLLAVTERGRSLAPVAGYRVALGVLVLASRRGRSGESRGRRSAGRVPGTGPLPAAFRRLAPPAAACV
jgi:undecaprenyl-diphosphatase